MSQIASAFIVGPDLLDQLGRHAAVDNYSAFWGDLHTDAVEVKPAYEYSGYVIAVLAAFLDESGIPLPVDVNHSGAQAIVDSSLGLILCEAEGDAKSTLERVRGLEADEAQLREYFEEMTDESCPDAGVAMQAGIEFICDGLEQVQGQNSWLLVFAG